MLPIVLAAMIGTASPAEAYANALAVMTALPQPASMKFAAGVTAQGVGIRLGNDSKRAVFEAGFGSGFKNAASWRAELRTSDNTATVRDERGTVLDVRSPLFKPVWRRAYEWAQYGLHGRPPEPVAAPTAAPVADGDDNVIGRVIALKPSAYRIEDGVAEDCPNAAPGRHLHLIAVRLPQKYPLTDVVVERETQRICMMRFNLGESGALSLTGSFQLDFGEASGYWVIKTDTAHLLFRIFGMGTKHADVKFVYDDITFPTGA